MTHTSGSSYYCELYLYINGTRLNFIAYPSSNGKTTGSDSASNSAVLTLSPGDTVFIKTDACYYLFSYPYTSFSGFKI